MYVCTYIYIYIYTHIQTKNTAVAAQGDAVHPTPLFEGPG